MNRKLMLHLIAALALTGCQWEPVALCADKEAWVDGEYVTEPNTDAACQPQDVEELGTEGGSN